MNIRNEPYFFVSFSPKQHLHLLSASYIFPLCKQGRSKNLRYCQKKLNTSLCNCLQVHNPALAGLGRLLLGTAELTDRLSHSREKEVTLSICEERNPSSSQGHKNTCSPSRCSGLWEICPSFAWAGWIKLKMLLHFSVNQNQYREYKRGCWHPLLR